LQSPSLPEVDLYKKNVLKREVSAKWNPEVATVLTLGGGIYMTWHFAVFLAPLCLILIKNSRFPGVFWAALPAIHDSMQVQSDE